MELGGVFSDELLASGRLTAGDAMRDSLAELDMLPLSTWSTLIDEVESAWLLEWLERSGVRRAGRHGDEPPHCEVSTADIQSARVSGTGCGERVLECPPGVRDSL